MLTITSAIVLIIVFLFDNQLASGTATKNKISVVKNASFNVSHKGDNSIIIEQCIQTFYKSLLPLMKTKNHKTFLLPAHDFPASISTGQQLVLLVDNRFDLIRSIYLFLSF